MLQAPLSEAKRHECPREKERSADLDPDSTVLGLASPERQAAEFWVWLKYDERDLGPRSVCAPGRGGFTNETPPSLVDGPSSTRERETSEP